MPSVDSFIRTLRLRTTSLAMARGSRFQNDGESRPTSRLNDDVPLADSTCSLDSVKLGRARRNFNRWDAASIESPRTGSPFSTRGRPALSMS
ncbi:hypothetical protein D3C71_1943950 [compost metagenome]